MRIPFLRLLAIILAAALVAVACSDDPTADELVDGATDGLDASDGTDADPDAGADPEETDPTAIPAATPPEVDGTPLPIDDDYRIGTLDNGLTYLLRSNDSPGASLDLRLLVNAGSLQQETPNDGSAHFLEHMMFNGTEAFPGNELTTQLQRLGIRFGADVNAYTSYDETVYLLGATTFEPSAPDIAFDVLAEWAARATIEPDQVAAEVGVVRDELRQGRETVDGFVVTRFEEIYTEGTPYENHIVIGDAELVEATTAETLRNYYETWYRPDNMAVVVVGDLPLDELESEVVSRFSSLTNPDTPLDRPEVEIELDPEPVTEIITHPDNGIDNLSLDIPLPVWDTGTVGGERMTLIETAVAAMIETRLGEAFQRGDLDFDRQPSFGAFSLNRGLRYYGTNVTAPELDTALDAFMGQLLLAALEGFTDDDVARVRELLVAGLDDELDTLASTQDWQYAGVLSDHFLTGGQADQAERRIARQREIIESFDADELTNFWRWILESSGPVVVAIGDDAATLPTPEQLREVLDNARPAATGDSAVAIDELMEPPEPAATASETTRSTLDGDIEEWTFENGVVVSYQESKIAEGNVSVTLESTGGWSTFENPDASLADAAVDAVLLSGVGPYGPATVERYLESRSIGIDIAIAEWNESINGSAATSDAEDLFALIHLTMTQPRVDDVALRSVARVGEASLELAETNPDVRAQELLTTLLNGDDQRYAGLHSQEEIDALDPGELLDVFSSRFGEVDDLHVAIVGDIAAAAAFDLSARYLGTLPTGDDDTWIDLGVELPTDAVRGEVILGDGTADGGLQRVDWVLGQPNAEDEVVGVLLSTIITNRITEVIREELGASYGGSATVFASHEGPGSIGSYISVDGDPTRLDEIRTALDEVLDELATTGPTADEFGRAVSVTQNDYGFVNNGLFLAANIAATRFPDVDSLQIDERFPILAGVARTDVRDLAAELFADPASVEVAKVLP
ncbi:MAG: insulinase family protein [Acidimicrobiales bacterium]